VIRAVCDTNIVVSGFLWAGAPAQVIDAAIDEQIRLLTSDVLIAELITVLSRPKFLPRFEMLGKSVEDFIANYRALVEIVTPAPIQPTVIADPTDDAVLACALTGKADYIVSGDKHLRILGSFKRIPIITTTELLEKLTEQTE
jgi:putative PIN family toxin of toxin-antitoxin system